LNVAEESHQLDTTELFRIIIESPRVTVQDIVPKW
jgi:hypothetical protein